MGIIIREKPLKNKCKSLYLDICFDGRRSYETLYLYLQPGTGSKIRELNKEARERAEKIKAKRWGEILTGIHGIEMKRNNRINVFDFLNAVVNEMELNNNRKIFKAALKQLSEYRNSSVLFPSDVTERFLEGYYDHLVKNFKGETPITYFKKIRRLLDLATKEKMFSVNPASDIKGRKYERREKDTLTEDELRLMVNTQCHNPDVKYGFLFSCNTGLRHCDIRQLRWNNINGKTLEFIQQKTKVKVCLELSTDALSILEKFPRNREFVFSLPTHRGCLIILHGKSTQIDPLIPA
jgi:integrase